MTVLRIRVRTRSERGVSGAKVYLDLGGTWIERETDKDGFIKPVITLNDDERTLASPPDEVDVRVRKFHHGPDRGPGQQVVAGEAKLHAKLGARTRDSSSAGVRLTHDDKGIAKHLPFLEIVLIDAGLARGAPSSKPTRRLTDEEYQRELMYHHVQGAVTVAPQSEFEFEHDTSTWEFAACTDRCTIKHPKADRRVSLTNGVVGPVTFFTLFDPYGVSHPRNGDVIPGQRFTRKALVRTSSAPDARSAPRGWSRAPVRPAEPRADDRRHLLDPAANGNSSGNSTHDYGLALDFGGCSTELPEPDARKMVPVRMGVRLLGLPALGARADVGPHHGGAESGRPFDLEAIPRQIQTRAASTIATIRPARGRDFTTASTCPRTKSLLPRARDPVLATKLGAVAPHFRKAREVFLATYNIAVDEDRDSNDVLGPLPASMTDTPTPIDDQHGHSILHPDYAKPNPPTSKSGRQAHVNHHHFPARPHFLLHARREDSEAANDMRAPRSTSVLYAVLVGCTPLPTPPPVEARPTATNPAFPANPQASPVSSAAVALCPTRRQNDRSAALG